MSLMMRSSDVEEPSFIDFWIITCFTMLGEMVHLELVSCADGLTQRSITKFIITLHYVVDHMDESLRPLS